MNAIPSAVAPETSRIDDRRAVDQHLAGVGLLDPADDLHQGGLAGAVLAEQRHDFSGVHVEAHATERLHAGKPLVDRAELEERRARSPAAELRERRPELVDVVLPYHSRRDEHLAPRRNAGSISLERLLQQRDRLEAELVGLLHDRADDRARLDARQRLVIFVERDDLHLPDPAGIPHGVENRGAVVAPQPDEGTRHRDGSRASRTRSPLHEPGRCRRCARR